jgi:hypothetical protein
MVPVINLDIVSLLSFDLVQLICFAHASYGWNVDREW